MNKVISELLVAVLARSHALLSSHDSQFYFLEILIQCHSYFYKRRIGLWDAFTRRRGKQSLRDEINNQ